MFKSLLIFNVKRFLLITFTFKINRITKINLEHRNYVLFTLGKTKVNYISLCWPYFYNRTRTEFYAWILAKASMYLCHTSRIKYRITAEVGKIIAATTFRQFQLRESLEYLFNQFSLKNSVQIRTLLKLSKTPIKIS